MRVILEGHQIKPKHCRIDHMTPGSLPPPLLYQNGANSGWDVARDLLQAGKYLGQGGGGGRLEGTQHKYDIEIQKRYLYLFAKVFTPPVPVFARTL